MHSLKSYHYHYGSKVPLIDYEVLSKEPESFSVGTLNTIVRILRAEVFYLQDELSRLKFPDTSGQ